ncbi:IclR family transcriptional regulator [Nocardioides insulae]|uniref:IclR family transcriptional regulator n=1 Tax=Nocardioides insulae TaxID=394734 RepID=UPI0004287ABA|nr:IclR family transcriptional regulator [Nocardioides insulae]
MSEDATATTVGPVRSVDRALGVLEILARDEQASLGALARELGVHRSTVSRLVSVLVGHDLVAPPRGSGGYRLGPGCLRLAAATAATLDVSTVAQPFCEGLAAELDETCNVAILREGMTINVCQAEGSSAVATRNWVGQRTAPHATSSGKILLAHLAADELAAVLPHRLERFTTHTITTRAALRRELRAVRRQGYSYAQEEYEVGLHAVAAPIRDHTGEVVAALSAAGPGYRLTEEAFPRVRETLLACAGEISRRLRFSAG